MQVIITKYHSATDHRPARYSAQASGGARIMLSVEDLDSTDQNQDDDHRHSLAAGRLMARLGWNGSMAGGHLKTPSGMIWVLFPPDPGVNPKLYPTTTAAKARKASVK